MHGVIEPFYETVSTRFPKVVGRGEIYLDQPIYLPMKYGIRLSNFDPTDMQDPDMELTGRTEDIFQHPPLKRYKLQHGEAFVVGKAKWERPVIVLAAQGYDLLAGPDKWQDAGSFVCAPIYGANQYSPEIRARIRAYEFPNLFYLPALEKPPFDEGFVRFDHMQAIRNTDLRHRRPLKLSTDALGALDEWLIYFLTARLNSDSLIELYRRDELGKLGKCSAGPD